MTLLYPTLKREMVTCLDNKNNLRNNRTCTKFANANVHGVLRPSKGSSLTKDNLSNIIKENTEYRHTDVKVAKRIKMRTWDVEQ